MKKMLKKIFSIGLALIIFCSSQSHVYAALNTGHSVSVKFVVLYVDSSFNIGYDFGDSESTTFICQYSVAHSDTAYSNHTIAESDIKAAAGRLSLDEGYQITGWTKNASKNPTINPLKTYGSTACNKGETIYLVAENSNPKITYTLNYNANGGTGAPTTQTENSYGNSHTFTVSNTVPTRDGYDFSGWADSQSATEVTYIGGDSITLTQSAPTKTIYAVWKLKDTPKQKYTVTYTDGVEDEVVFADQTNRVNEGEETPAFVGTPKRNGHFFAGWTPEVAAIVTKDVTYTAVWKEDKNGNGKPDEDEEKYTVTYTDGVENETVFEDKVYDNLLSGTQTPAFDGTPTREGYVFKGWNPDVAETVTKDATYTAVWKEDKNNNGVADEDEEKYTVTYTDGVENETVFEDKVYDNLLSGTQTPAFDGTPTREGYTFKGWNPEVAETVTNNVTYVAQWEKIAQPCTVQIKIYRNGNTKDVYKTVNLPKVNKGDSLDLSQLDINKYYSSSNGFESEEWYNDGGWNQYKAGNHNNKLENSITITGWTNIYAMVTDYENVVVKSVTNGDKANAKTISNGKVLHGSDLISYLNEKVKPENKKGYTLDKWYNWDWYGHKFDSNKKVTGWTNVYVTYTPIQYQINYNGNGGFIYGGKKPVSKTTQTVKYDQEITLKGNDTFKREGYVCVGWSLNKNSTEAKYQGGQTGVFNFKDEEGKSVNLWAVWKEDKNNNDIPDEDEEKQPIYIQIYRNGNTENPYKSIKIGEMLEGLEFNVKDLNINDYYSSQFGFESENWYNDGGWNDYKAGNPNNTLGDTIKVNGWTNIIAMVTDYENVVVKSVTNGDKDNAETIFTGKALHGSDLAAYLNKEVELEDKTGYTLDKWYNWDWYGHKIGENATVNGWTNVYVTYTANKYTVVYHGNGGVLISNPDKDQTTSTFEYGKETTLKNKNTFTRDGYIFLGWSTAPDGKVEYQGGQKEVFNLTAKADDKVHLYAVWTPKATPLDPVVASYKVEYYLEQEDGTFVLKDSYIGYGKIGETVTADEKEYENYVEDLDNENALISGVIVKPEVVDEKPVILTLKRYYKLKDTDNIKDDDKKDENNNNENNNENNSNENNNDKKDDKVNNIVVTDDTNKPNKDNQNDQKDNQDKKVENKTNNPTTGDDSQLGLMLGTILLSASGLFLLQKRKEEN